MNKDFEEMLNSYRSWQYYALAIETLVTCLNYIEKRGADIQAIDTMRVGLDKLADQLHEGARYLQNKNDVNDLLKTLRKNDDNP